jgi:hypothetical protein
VASPETLFKIGFDDGTAYARAGRQEADATGTTPEVFEFDVDGTLVAEAEQRHTHSSRCPTKASVPCGSWQAFATDERQVPAGAGSALPSLLRSTGKQPPPGRCCPGLAEPVPGFACEVGGERRAR